MLFTKGINVIFVLLLIMLLPIGSNGQEGCYHDCFYGTDYHGIRAADIHGRVCKRWDHSDYTEYSRRSNFCVNSEGYTPWCPINGGWEYCAIPYCEHKRTECVRNLQIETTSTSITGRWSAPAYSYESPIGYLVLLYNQNKYCEDYGYNGKYVKYHNKLYNLYAPCKRNKQNVYFSGFYSFTFTRVTKYHYYTIYIMPVIDKATIGAVKYVTTHTRPAAPHTISGLILSSRRSNQLTFVWNRVVQTSYSDAVSYYKVVVTSQTNKSIKNLIKSYTNSIELSNLKICTVYCVQIVAVNEAGEGGSSTELCRSTKGQGTLGTVKLDKIRRGYEKIKRLSWRHSGTNNCIKWFKVAFRKLGDKNWKSSWINKTNTFLDKLPVNSIFEVLITGAVDKYVLHDESVVTSETVQFYTGNDQFVVREFIHEINSDRDQLDALWQLKKEDILAISMYHIIVRNENGQCVNSTVITYGKAKYLSSQYSYIPQENMCDTMTIIRRNTSKEEISTASIKLAKKVKKYSLEMYAYMPMGWRLITDASIQRRRSHVAKYSSIPIVVVILILVMIIVTLYYRNRFRTRSKDINSRDCSTESNKEENKLEMNRSGANKNKMSLRLQSFIETSGNSHSIPTNQFTSYVTSVMEDDNKIFTKEYKNLDLETKIQIKNLRLTFTDGKSGVNKKKNRYGNILPYDQSRVKLTDNVCSDYINANWIPFEENESMTEYIATQGPTVTTADDFWVMVWQQNVSCIVMLSNVIEDNKQVCSQYWPDKEDNSQEWGYEKEIKVKLCYETKRPYFYERSFAVHNEKTGEKRNIDHLQLHTECNFSKEDINDFESLLLKFDNLVSNGARYPVLVHCSAGVGRTGTFITLDRITRKLSKESTGTVNVYDTVLNLRRYRPMMVQKEVQYVFIYQYLCNLIQKKNNKNNNNNNLNFNVRESECLYE